MTRPRIVVVGGGLAGLTAGVACMDAGAQVTLLESRLRLGGATWSSQRGGLWIDNGQHVFLRCFDAYRELLRRLGVEDRVHLQSRLAMPVAAPGAKPAWLRRGVLPSPLHLAPSLAGFHHLSLLERLRVAATVRQLSRLDLADPQLDRQSFGDWLSAHGASADAIACFWELLVRPTLNLPAAEASLALATKVFQTGLLEAPENADIGWSKVPLQELHGDAAHRVLEAGGARVVLRARVDRIEEGAAPGRAWSALTLWCDGTSIEADAVVLAADHEQAARLLPAAAGLDREGVSKLGRSPIVNLHIVLDRRVCDHAFVAGVRTPLEFVFDRTQGSGLATGQYLAVSLSAADRYVGCSRRELRERFLPELERLFPRARGARVVRFFATCERSATFRQAPGTRGLRAATATRIPGLVLAGAWTDTGWPATMEGAARSGVAAARGALAAVGRDRAPNALAA